MDSAKSATEQQNGSEPLRTLIAAPRGEPIALLHPCGVAPARLFLDPIEELTVPPEEWAEAFGRLSDFLARHRDRECFGYLGYDLRDGVEALPRRIPDDLPLPVVHVVAYGRVETWAAATVGEPDFVVAGSDLRAHASRDEYEQQVARVVEHIRAGDIFQANLTQPFTGRFDGDPRGLFWQLCHRSPAPFASYLETGDGLSVLSSSPEEFLWADDRDVRTLPIKGTRPRSALAAEDRALLEELLDSEKDQAELAMIVDLMRNDLGKVAEPGSVRVGPFPEHESFAQVHHLFTEVSATLLPGVDAVDLLRATFPPGSITGAPKLRCMEILEDLEWVRRGVYTGAIGSFGPGPRLHLNVAIRTMVHRDGVVRFNTGGGVTADSDPAAEFEETLAKAAGMRDALRTEIRIP